MMARVDDLALQMAELNDLHQDPDSPDATKSLQSALAGRSNHLAALAAQIVGEHQLEHLVTDLVAAFKRFMIKPIKSDPVCIAKIAIVESLRQLDAAEEDVYLRAIHHKQMEPVYGGREDTAGELRASSALALVQINYLEVMVELAELLADSEVDARIGAARAIGFAGKEATLPLLRYKILVGDEDARVFYECFAALLRLDPQPSIGIVGERIQDEDPAVAEAAALAIGESHLVGAFPILKERWDLVEEPSVGRAILLAIALLRMQAATDFLISLIAEAPLHQAADSLLALDMYRYDEDVWARVKETVAWRGEAELTKIVSGE